MNDAVWRALADPTRRRVLDLLRDGPRTTGDLAAAFPDVTRFAVMKHLDVLTAARLVTVRRRGRERWNHLNAVPLRQAYERWLAPYAERAAITSLRLKDFAEGDGMNGTIDIANEVTVAAPPGKVWAGLLRIGEWWPHRFQEGTAVRLEAAVGGRFWEDLGDGNGAHYGTVTRIDAPRRLVIRGPMGMDGPVVGVWTIDLEDAGDTTVLRHTHRAFGDIDDDTRQSYEHGWGDVYAALLQHLDVAR